MALGSAYIDFYNNDNELILGTYDGIFAISNLNNLNKFLILFYYLVSISSQSLSSWVLVIDSEFLICFSLFCKYKLFNEA